MFKQTIIGLLNTVTMNAYVKSGIRRFFPTPNFLTTTFSDRQIFRKVDIHKRYKNLHICATDLGMVSICSETLQVSLTAMFLPYP